MNVKRYVVMCLSTALLWAYMSVEASEFPRRFAIESSSPDILPQITLLDDGLSAAQGIAFISWGDIQPNPPVNGVNTYEPLHANSWWEDFLEELDATDRGLVCTLIPGDTPWAIERDAHILVQNPQTGDHEPGLLRIHPEYTHSWQAFIKHLLALTPQITHLQIDSEAENVWTHAPGYIQALSLAYDAVQEFNSENPGRDVKVISAGYNLESLIQVPDTFIENIVAAYPAMANIAGLEELYPDVNPNLLQLWSRKLHLVVGVLSQEDPANPNFDFLSVHHDSGRTYDSIGDLVAWYRQRMADGVHGAYDRPIWVDDMSSNYHVARTDDVSAEDLLLLDGLDRGDEATIAAYNAKQPEWLAKKVVGHFGAGIERVSIAYGHDIPTYFLPIWRYMGLCTTNSIAKPAYHTTHLLVEKLDGFTSATRIQLADTNNYLFHFSFAAKPDVFVAWRENEGILDLTAYATGTTLRATHLVQETTPEGDAIVQPVEEFPANAVSVTPEPVFLEATDSLPPRVPVYRFWSKVYNSHFFTISAAERDFIMNKRPDTLAYEGIAFYAYASELEGASPVHRFWSPVYRKPFFTISESESEYIIATSPDVWSYKGTAWYARPMAAFDTQAVHRFWSPANNAHFLTISTAERDYILATWPDIWTYEGIAFHAYASGTEVTAKVASTPAMVTGVNGKNPSGQDAVKEDGLASETKANATLATTATVHEPSAGATVENLINAQDGVWIPVLLDGVDVAAAVYDPQAAAWDLAVPPTNSPEALFLPTGEVGRRYWLAVFLSDPEARDWRLAHGSWLGRLPEAPARQDEYFVDKESTWMGVPVELVQLPPGEELLSIRVFCPEEERYIQTISNLAGGSSYPIAIPRWNAWYRVDILRAKDGAVLQSHWMGHHRTH